LSPRQRKFRLVGYHPGFRRFQPVGDFISAEAINLTIEELEAIRLKDLENLDQEEAAQQMGVSRSTFQRILYSARSKIAEALVEGKELEVKGGNYQMAMREFTCDDCGHTWQVPFGTGTSGREMTCPNCGSHNIHRIDHGRHGHGTGLRGQAAHAEWTGEPPGAAQQKTWGEPYPGPGAGSVPGPGFGPRTGPGRPGGHGGPGRFGGRGFRGPR